MCLWMGACRYLAVERSWISREPRELVFDPSPKNEAILRWGADDFTAAEQIMAERWRDSTKALDLEGFRNSQRRKRSYRAFKNLDNVKRYVEWLLSPADAGESRYWRLSSGVCRCQWRPIRTSCRDGRVLVARGSGNLPPTHTTVLLSTSFFTTE